MYLIGTCTVYVYIGRPFLYGSARKKHYHLSCSATGTTLALDCIYISERMRRDTATVQSTVAASSSGFWRQMVRDCCRRVWTVLPYFERLISVWLVYDTATEMYLLPDLVRMGYSHWLLAELQYCHLMESVEKCDCVSTTVGLLACLCWSCCPLLIYYS